MQGIPISGEDAAQAPLEYAVTGITPHIAYPDLIQTAFVPDLRQDGSDAAAPAPAAAATIPDAGGYATEIPSFM